MFRVYFSVLWLISNVGKFIFNNTTKNNTFINNINVKNTNIKINLQLQTINVPR